MDLQQLLEPLASVVSNSESELSEAVARRLRETGTEFETEVWLNDTDRIDYLVGRVGVELKLKGTVSAVTRQLARYAQSDQIDSLVLVTTRPMHKHLPKTLCGKSVTVVCVGGWL